MSPHETLEMVRSRLAASVYSDVRHVQCGLRGGIVVLSGRVKSFYMKQLAQEAVKNGCVVVNEIEVLPETIRWDESRY